MDWKYRGEGTGRDLGIRKGCEKLVGPAGESQGTALMRPASECWRDLPGTQEGNPSVRLNE